MLTASKLAERILPPDSGRLFVKADHALPVAGSIKARGGTYAVLHFAEKLALECGLLDSEQDDCRKLATPAARALFADYELSVGSTGNLGLSIGIAGAALGFQVAVHMSVEAKAWKKKRLRRRGVKVVEYATDYTAACVVARAEAATDPRKHFIDDENSVELFLGCACAVPKLKRQLANAGIVVDREHPLFIYLACAGWVAVSVVRVVRINRQKADVICSASTLTAHANFPLIRVAPDEINGKLSCISGTLVGCVFGLKTQIRYHFHFPLRARLEN